MLISFNFLHINYFLFLLLHSIQLCGLYSFITFFIFNYMMIVFSFLYGLIIYKYIIFSFIKLNWFCFIKWNVIFLFYMDYIFLNIDYIYMDYFLSSSDMQFFFVICILLFSFFVEYFIHFIIYSLCLLYINCIILSILISII